MRLVRERHLRFVLCFGAMVLIVWGMLLPLTAQDDTPPVSTNVYDEGLALIQQGDYQGAIDYFTQFIQAGGDDAWMYLYRAMAYNNNGQRGLAFDDLDTAEELNPDLPNIYSYRATIFMISDRPGRSLVELNHALALDPTFYDALLVRSNVYGMLHNYPDAFADLNAAIALQPESPWAYLVRGVLYIELDDFAAALRDYRAYVALVGENVDQETLDQLAQLEIAAEGTPIPPTPTLAYEVGATATPSAYAAQQDAIRALNRQDYAAAVDAYTIAISLNPNNPALYAGRLNAYMQLRDFEAALTDANQMIALEPNVTINRHNRAITNFFLNDLDAVIDDENAVIASNPTFAFAYLFRAAAFAGSGLSDKACADFQTFVQLSPHTNDVLVDAVQAQLSNYCPTETGG